MRILPLLIAAAVPTAAIAAADAPYYGPMKPWHGIGYKFGYDDKDKDGVWRVDAAVRSGEAVDMAMYRVAERAHDGGYRFVQLLGGMQSTSPGRTIATVYAMPSHSPAAPTACRSGKAGSCYTADVADLLRRLSGPTGTTPGVAIVDHRDSYGREVTYSGFGLAPAASTASLTAPAVTPPTPMPFDPNAPRSTVVIVPRPVAPGAGRR